MRVRSVPSDTEKGRIPEPHMNLTPDKMLTLVCWKLHLLNAVGQESVLWKTGTSPGQTVLPL